MGPNPRPELPPLDLALVMPVYNEEACIASVVGSWRDELTRTVGASVAMVVLDDGSSDATASELQRFADDPVVGVIAKPNSGHGPTILLGYQEATERARWVFQVDSDDEMSPAHFAGLWRRRDAFDALFAVRQGRSQNLGRRLITLASRLAVRVLFRSGVADVNVPYRLMRSDVLRAILPLIPPNTFAPNVAISGLFARTGSRLANVPVPHQGRKTGRVSIARLRLVRAAMRSSLQTLRIALGSRSARHRLVATIAAASSPEGSESSNQGG